MAAWMNETLRINVHIHPTHHQISATNHHFFFAFSGGGLISFGHPVGATGVK